LRNSTDQYFTNCMIHFKEFSIDTISLIEAILSLCNILHKLNLTSINNIVQNLILFNNILIRRRFKKILTLILVYTYLYYNIDMNVTLIWLLTFYKIKIFIIVQTFYILIVIDIVVIIDCSKRSRQDWKRTNGLLRRIAYFTNSPYRGLVDRSKPQFSVFKVLDERRRGAFSFPLAIGAVDSCGRSVVTPLVGSSLSVDAFDHDDAWHTSTSHSLDD